MTIGVHICSGSEWRATQELMPTAEAQVSRFPYGEFFHETIAARECVFYHSRRTKTRAAGACQYAIDHWDPCLNAAMNLS